MFGVIPRVSWEKLMPPDDENRFRMACWCVLAEIGDRRVLVEAGMGDKYDEKERQIYGVTDQWVAPSLEAIGVLPASIDLVVLTHLHFDHAGGLTLLDDSASASAGQQLVFPNAEVVVQQGEWQDAFDNYSTTRSSYRPEELQPVKDAGRLRLVEGSVEVADGVSVRVTPGHTRHHQSVILAGPKRTACFVGEPLATIHHARPSYQMAYDLMPMETMRQKAMLMEEAEANEWLLPLDHDPDHPVVTVTRDDRGRFVLQDHAPREEVLADWITL